MAEFSSTANESHIPVLLTIRSSENGSLLLHRFGALCRARQHFRERFHTDFPASGQSVDQVQRSGSVDKVVCRLKQSIKSE